MKSKEALKRIETVFSLNREGKTSVYKEYTNSIYPYYEDFDLVMRDLEVLEILKELFSNNDYLTILLKTNYLYKIKDETKLNLIKEWLEK